jgi:hypothetical protein
MVEWSHFEQSNPVLGAFGKERLSSRVAYLATIRADGGPRVHPVTPIIGDGHLYIYMEPTSPKGHDLLREPRYALHSCSERGTGQRAADAMNGVPTGTGRTAVRPYFHNWVCR